MGECAKPTIIDSQENRVVDQPAGDVVYVDRGGRSLLYPQLHVSDLLLQIFSRSSSVNSWTSLLGHTLCL